ncbi:MAG: FHA domain-containing protein [Planctomycetota bacterium]
MTADTPDRLEPDPPDRSGATLIALSGNDRGTHYPIPPDGELSIGRAERNDIVVHDAEVSRRHCSLVARDGRFRLVDRGSTNGCFVDGEKVPEADLESGARIFLGGTTFAFARKDDTRAVPAVAEAERPAAQPAPAPAPAEPAPRAPSRRRRLGLAAAGLALAAGIAAAAVLLHDRQDVDERRPPGGPTRTIKLAASPSGAEVFLDDRFLGLAPLEFDAPAGLHALRVTRTGYQTWRTRIDADTPAALSAELEPEPTATLLVTASQPDASVYIDGRPAGRTRPNRPLRIENVRLGRHEIRFKKPNCLPHVIPLDLRKTGERHLYGKLQSRQEAALLYLARQEPNNASRQTELGHHYMITRELDKAMSAYRRAWELVLSGEDTSSYARRLKQEMQKVLTRSIFQYGDETEAKEARKRLEDMFIGMLPDYPAARARLENIATYYRKHGDIDDAIRLYRKMLEQEPDNLSFCYKVASLCTTQGRHGDAIDILLTAAQKHPKSWQVRYRLGRAYLRRAQTETSWRDRKAAIEHLESALESCQSNVHKRNIRTYLKQARDLEFEE